MKLKINRKSFLSALKHCGRLSRKRNETPITDCVIIDAKTTDQGEQLLYLRATDLEVWVEVQVKAVIEQDGCVAPLCTNLERIVSAITHDDIIIMSQKGRISISPGDLSGTYPVNCLPADLFPVPGGKEEDGGDMSEGRREMPREFSFENNGIIDRVLAKNSGERKNGTAEAAEVIESLLFLDLGDEFLTVAHHRGHSAGMEISSIPKIAGSFSLPISGALLMSGIDGSIMTVSGKWVVFRAGGITITIRETDRCNSVGELARAREHLTSFQNKVCCNRFDLLGAIKRVKLCEEKNEFGGAIYLELGKPLIVKGETGDGIEEISDVHLEGDTGRVLIATTLIEHQLAVLGDRLSIYFSDIGEGKVCQAIGIKDLDNDEYLGFIAGRMP